MKWYELYSDEAGKDSNAIISQLSSVIRNVNLELSEKIDRFRILGPNMSHMNADPELKEVLAESGLNYSADSVLRFHESCSAYDFSLEDSWSGYFIAKELSKNPDVSTFAVLHLDDHMDMMPALLTSVDGALYDLASGSAFHCKSPGDWEGAIKSGGVGIGNFFTPFFWSMKWVDIVHLSAHPALQREKLKVVLKPLPVPLTRNTKIIGLRLTDQSDVPAVGSYFRTDDPYEALSMLPKGTVFGHVDLDYFENSYNGRGGLGKNKEKSSISREGLSRMSSFLGALRETDHVFKRWIVATSPGFCAARYWKTFTDELALVLPGTRNLP